MRNGDYLPTRFEGQSDAVNLLANAKTSQNPESTVGLITMAGKRVEVVQTLVQDPTDVLSAMHRVQISGEADLSAGLETAQLALKHRANKNGGQRIVVFLGSPISEDAKALTKVGKKLKKSGIAVDVITLGSELEDDERIKAFIDAVNKGGSSHLVHVPSGVGMIADMLVSSPIFFGDMGGDEGGDGQAAGGGGGGGGGAHVGGGGGGVARQRAGRRVRRRQPKRKRRRGQRARRCGRRRRGGGGGGGGRRRQELRRRRGGWPVVVDGAPWGDGGRRRGGGGEGRPHRRPHRRLLLRRPGGGGSYGRRGRRGGSSGGAGIGGGGGSHCGGGEASGGGGAPLQSRRRRGRRRLGVARGARSAGVVGGAALQRDPYELALRLPVGLRLHLRVELTEGAEARRERGGGRLRPRLEVV